MTIGLITKLAKYATRLVDLFNPAIGADVIPMGDTNVGQYLKSMGPLVSITDKRFNGGAKGDGVTDDSKAIQMALNYVASFSTGGRVFVPVPLVEYLCTYPSFVQNNTEFFGIGAASRIVYLNPTFAHGRGGIIIGSSLEANRELGLIAYSNNTFPAATVNNPNYVNLPLGTYLRDNPTRAETRNGTVHDLCAVARWTTGAGWGGYAVNFVNAWDCHAWNIWGEGWTQIIGMGSDVAPETPSNHMCTAENIHVVKPDPIRTYYAGGFMANSTDCHAKWTYQHAPCTGTKEGNIWAANSCENSSIQHVYCEDLGKIGSSTGVYVADSRDFFVDNIRVGNCKRVVQTFFFRPESITAERPITIGKNICGVDSDVVVSLGTKWTRLLGFTNINCTYDVEFYNTNVTGCEVQQKPEKINYGAGWTDYQYLDNNKVRGWQPVDIYLRPSDMLLNDKVDTQSWGVNKSVSTKAGVSLSFMYKIPINVTAIRGFTLYTTYAGDSQTAGMNITASVRRMAAYNGNSGEAAVIHQTINAPGATPTTTDRLLTSTTSLVMNADATSGLPYSLDYLIQVTAPTLNSTIKETRLRCYM